MSRTNVLTFFYQKSHLILQKLTKTSKKKPLSEVKRQQDREQELLNLSCSPTIELQTCAPDSSNMLIVLEQIGPLSPQ